MKKIITITVSALLAAGLGLAYYACASYLPTSCRSIVESALLDQTEPFLLHPAGSEILIPADLPEHKWESIQLHVRTLSEYKFTESYLLMLSGGFFLLANPDDRDKEILKFQTKVDSVISAINKQDKGYPESSIYVPFIEEVNRVAAAKADVKSVIAYTDLCENTGIFSVYREQDRNLLLRHPEEVRELLSKYCKPSDLRGVTIYIVFKPKSDRDDEYFSLMSGFYRKLLEDAGARVCIGANLVTDNK